MFPIRYLDPKLACLISPKEHKATPAMATKKLIYRTAFILSFKSRKANMVEITGRLKVKIAALLAVENCVPWVIKTCAGKAPSKASRKKTKISLNCFLLFLKSLMANGASNGVAISIGAPTVKFHTHIHIQINRKSPLPLPQLIQQTNRCCIIHQTGKFSIREGVAQIKQPPRPDFVWLVSQQHIPRPPPSPTSLPRLL